MNRKDVNTGRNKTDTIMWVKVHSGLSNVHRASIRSALKCNQSKHTHENWITDCPTVPAIDLHISAFNKSISLSLSVKSLSH